ncbi:Nuclear pore complex protein Nup98-Nup96, partial [Frankliniella fusca]
MAAAWLGALALAALLCDVVLAGPVPVPAAGTASTAERVRDVKQLAKYTQQQLDAAELRLQEAKNALIKQLIVDVARDQGIHGAVEAARVEEALEEEILTAAGAARGNKEELHKLDDYVKRDKRALSLITGLLGGAGPVDRGPTYSAYIGAGSGGFGIGSKLNILTSLLGSSSGGGGGGGGSSGGDDASAGGGSDSGSILSLVTPLLGSSSSGGGGGGGDSSDSSAGGGGGSDSGSILGLVTPLLGSSSGGG